MTTFLGNPVTLEGKVPEVGDTFESFTVLDQNLNPVVPTEDKKTKILLSVPSVDTPVCSMELAKFMNAVKDNEDVDVYSVSMDLPFALARWCQANNARNITPTSDFKDRSFAKAAGVRMAENGLLARGVFVLNPENQIVYEEIVDEVSHEPDYQKALNAAGVQA